MTAVELLTELRERGIFIETSGNRLRIDAPRGAVTPELREALVEHKSQVIALIAITDTDIAWRVKAMLPQIPDVGPIPFLVAREAVEPQKECCLSCGDPLNFGDAYQCTPCSRAANQALEFAMSRQHDNPKNQEGDEKRC